MSRETEYVRKCSDVLIQRIEKAKRAKFYVLQELGPLSFIISEDSETARKFRISLGSRHTCSCGKFQSEGSLCKHTLWVMLKVFLIPATSDILYQTSLVDREIDDMLRSRRSKKVAIDPVPQKQELVATTDLVDLVPARTIAEGDICPICQDELSANDGASRTIHCFSSCGNNIHTKCLKILINHQKSLGKDSIACPLCRNELGKIDSIMSRIEQQKKPMINTYLHVKHECKECHDTPRGNLYRCTLCKDHYLCRECFDKGSHPEHAFEFIPKKHQPWKSASRAVEPTLPPNLVQDLQNRELKDEDYQLLLQLDGKQQQGTIPLNIINSFPVVKLCSARNCVKARLDEHRICKVCVAPISFGELIRQIPCGHGFHQHCIGIQH
jgi:E3 ubiquitin-protein ligase ZSWIM2